MNPSTAANIIEITGLSRKYGAKLALKDLSLQAARGRVFGLVGANGAGKTTLIKHVFPYSQPPPRAL
jgi:ABC-2 type transport system ATP-binding protein